MSENTIPFDVLNRWSGQVQLTAQIECAVDALPSIKLGLAVRWAAKLGASLHGANLRDADLLDANLRDADLRDANLRDADLRDANLRGADLHGANLRDADLRDANLRDANLRDANLRGANLRDANLRDASLHGADLRGADLHGADLRSFKADLWLILASAQHEIFGLVSALREGRVNGSTYSGECACLVGTIANVRGVSPMSLERDSGRPAERWFMMIKTGDKPGDESGGGFANKVALDWTLEFCSTFGIDPDAPPVATSAEAA